MNPAAIVPNVNLLVSLCAGERPFKCESCNYLAANQHEVTRHARQVHNGPKPLSCPYCDYKTADRSNYKKHVELHLNPRQFLCPLCKYAASKKCNLQYHIKSRHAGCDVAMDISKVKLRVKKAGPHGGEEENAREHKLSNVSNAQEDLDTTDRDGRDKGVEANPINLSIRRSSRPGTSQAAPSDAPDKVQEKTCCPSDREKPAKAKEQDKRVTTRQKVKRTHENIPEEEVHPGSTTAGRTLDGRAKTKVKKLQAEKTTVENPSGDQDQALRLDQQQSEDRRKARPDKENQSGEGSRKKKKKALHKSRRTGSQQSEKTSRPADHSQQKTGGLQQIPEKKAAKEKATKRRAAEVLDLTQTSPDVPPKTRRMKGAEKLHPSPEEPGKTGQMGSTMTTKQKSKMAAVKDDHPSVRSHPSVVPAPLQASAGTSSKPKNSSAKKEDLPALLRAEEPREARDGPPTPASPGKPQPCSDTPQKPVNSASPLAPGPAAPAEVDQGPALSQDAPGGTPPPPLSLPVEQSKPSDPEDDEGIHSSHEGGSDISDSASEGSEDSGLNSNGSGSGKLANDPETPTEELPTPTELKSYLCIFCDRSFPLEAAYRRHLHRHLLNVYDMDKTGGRGHSSDQKPSQASEAHPDRSEH